MLVKLLQDFAFQEAPVLTRASYIAHMNQTWVQSKQTFVEEVAGYLDIDWGGPDNWLLDIQLTIDC